MASKTNKHHFTYLPLVHSTQVLTITAAKTESMLQKINKFNKGSQCYRKVVDNGLPSNLWNQLSINQSTNYSIKGDINVGYWVNKCREYKCRVYKCRVYKCGVYKWVP